MRYGYYKELFNLREQLFWREKSKANELDDNNGKSSFEEIDVRYFDISEYLPKEYAELMNIKLKEMKDSYDTIL